MGMPIYVPLLLVLVSVSIIGADVGSMEGAAFLSERETVGHANDNITFFASIQAPLEGADEVRTPRWHPSVFVDVVQARRVLVTENHSEPGSDVVMRITLRQMDGSNGSGSQEGHAALERLEEQAEFIVIPTWELAALAAGDNVTVLHAGEQAFEPHRVPAGLPRPPEQTPQSEQSLALVWLVRNTTDDYQQLSGLLLDNGLIGRSIVAVDTDVLAWDPWLRGAAAVAAAAAIVLAIMPRAHSLPRALPRGRGGTSIDMAEVGARFLQSLRNAYVGLAIALAVIGFSLAFAVGSYASMVASGDALHYTRPAGFDWQMTIRGVLVLAFVAAVLAASRPALEAHQAVRRWRQNESSPPIEGELGP